jgi:hypothetical protein
MPFIKFTVFKRRALLVLFIILLSEIIISYSYCTKKKLLYIVIISLFKYQPSSYSKYTVANIQSLYNIYSVSLIKCT